MRFITIPAFTSTLLATSALAWNDNYGKIADDEFSIHVYRARQGDVKPSIMMHGTGASKSGPHIFPQNKDYCDAWHSFGSWLPYTVDVHPGHVCGSTNFDNLWINYATYKLNVPTAKECKTVTDGNGHVLKRCVLKITP